MHQPVVLLPWLLFSAEGTWSQCMMLVTEGSGEAVWMNMPRSKSSAGSRFWNSVSASVLSATTLKPAWLKTGSIRAWVSSRRLLPVLIVQRIVGTVPSLAQ